MSVWPSKPLGEVACFERGLTYSKGDEVSHSRNGVLRANNIDLLTKSLDLSDVRYIADTIRVPPTKKVQKGSLLICTASGSRLHLGKVALIGDDYDLAFGGFMGLITPRADLDSRFLYYALTGDSFQEKLASLASGTNINNLKFKDIVDFPVPYPPLEEQQRIVAVLDEAFAAIATATANAEKNLANARELFGLASAQLFASADEQWGSAPLASISDFQGGSQPPKSTFVGAPCNGYVRLLQIRDFKSDKSAVYIPESKRNKLCREDDVMIARYGASVGQIHRGKSGAYNVALIRTIPNKDKIDRDYFYHFLKSPRFQIPLLAVASRSAQDGFSKHDISDFQVPLPPLSDQKRLIGKLLNLDRNCEALASAYAKKAQALAELKQSLLTRAFSGELTGRELEPA